ncbi:MAG: NAD(P)-dependent oxidoreductase [Methylotenera sp.]|nr:NAD(P)-dependent oxidoreductase [Methylotenera sp.]MDP1960535.1 NAD(P)-dependent oxidoreductase [Methylotenera sp.]
MIVLTGATGFLGSNLLGKLLADGYEVAAIVRTNSNLHGIEKWIDHKNIKLYNIEKTNLRLIFEENKVDAIVHTATEYGRGEGAISKILEPNLILPIRLIELGIEHKTACFINTDSYFNKVGSSYSNLLNYSLSKKSLLVWLQQLSNRIRVINVTLEHMYGPWDSRSKFVENLIQEIAVERISRVHLTHGHQKRDFVYVDEVAEAFIKLIGYGCSHDFSFKSFEVGTGKSIQVRDFAQKIKDISHSSSLLGFGDIEYRSDEIMDSKADISTLAELGWVPKVGIQEGLSRILDCYGVNVDIS